MQRRTTPPEPDHVHEHEFVGEPEIFNDGYEFTVTHYCDYAEHSSAGHSERLDETFYKTEYSCDATQDTHYVFDHVYWVDPDGNEHTEGNVDILDIDAEWGHFFEEFILRLPEYIDRPIDIENDEVMLHIFGDLWAVYEKSGQKVRE